MAHGPLEAETYLSGTHETMQGVQDEERKEGDLIERVLKLILRSISSASPRATFGQEKQNMKRNPLHYESQRWTLAKEVSNAEGYFRCKHGSIPDAGERGEDPLRYFGWNERFLLPFVNETKRSRPWEGVTPLPPPQRLRAGINSGGGGEGGGVSDSDATYFSPSPWAAWRFNATRRRCVHEAVNVLLSMPPSDERANLTLKFRASCSVC